MRNWLLQGENIEATESALVVSREHNTEMERGKELLTIKEMFDEGFSQFLGLFCLRFQQSFLFIAPYLLDQENMNFEISQDLASWLSVLHERVKIKHRSLKLLSIFTTKGQSGCDPSKE